MLRKLSLFFLEETISLQENRPRYVQCRALERFKRWIVGQKMGFGLKVKI